MDSATLRIALAHDWLTGMRGGEKCLEPMCRHFPTAPLYTLLRSAGSTSPVIENRAIRTSVLQRIPGARRHYRYMLPLMPLATELLRIREPVDLLLSFSHAVAKSLRAPEGVPHVCYCFTPMRYAWQMREQYFRREDADQNGIIAGRVRGSMAAARDAVLDAIQRWDRDSSRRVTHFVACSQTIARRIAECYGRESQVIYPPVDTDFYTPTDIPREDFYLCVSALVPYKRIELAIAACQALGRKLIIIGAGPKFRCLAEQADKNVALRGWQSDEVIRDHMRRCRALLFPGEEDFGIVPVEAQACGAPVIAFGRGGATETVVHGTSSQPGTGLHFAEQSVESLAEAMLSLESQPELCSAALGRENAERFSRVRYEQQMLSLLGRVAGRCSPSSLRAISQSAATRHTQ